MRPSTAQKSREKALAPSVLQWPSSASQSVLKPQLSCLKLGLRALRRCVGNGLISEPVNLLSCVLRSEKEDRDKMGLVWTQLGCLLSDSSWHFSFILSVSWQNACTITMFTQSSLPCNLLNDRGGLAPDLFASTIHFISDPLQKMSLSWLYSGCFLTGQSWKPLKCKAKTLSIYDPLSALSSLLPVFNWPAWAQLEASVALIILSHVPPVLVIEPRTSCKHPVTPQILWITLLLLPVLLLSVLASLMPSLLPLHSSSEPGSWPGIYLNNVFDNWVPDSFCWSTQKSHTKEDERGPIGKANPRGTWPTPVSYAERKTFISNSFRQDFRYRVSLLNYCISPLRKRYLL